MLHDMRSTVSPRRTLPHLPRSLTLFKKKNRHLSGSLKRGRRPARKVAHFDNQLFNWSPISCDSSSVPSMFPMRWEMRGVQINYSAAAPGLLAPPRGGAPPFHCVAVIFPRSVLSGMLRNRERFLNAGKNSRILFKKIQDFGKF